MYNKGLLQQNYQNEMGKAQTIANTRLGQGTALANNLQQAGDAKAKMWSGIGSGVGSALNAPIQREHELEVARLSGKR